MIWSKLRRDEHFAFSFVQTAPERRLSIWLNPSIPLAFEFTGLDVPQLNPAWLDQLRKTANSAGGLVLTPEPDTSTT